MYIWNAIGSFLCCKWCNNKPEPSATRRSTTTAGNRRVSSLSDIPLGEESFADESAPLLPPGSGPSLTAGYTDYMHSNNAIRLFLFHITFYYAIAVLLFSYVLPSKYTIIDSLYYSTVLFTTVGYGDLSPTSDAGRFATMVVASYGIVILGIFLGIYGEALLEHHESKEKDEVLAVRKTVCEVMNSSMKIKKSSSTAWDTAVTAAAAAAAAAAAIGSQSMNAPATTAAATPPSPTKSTKKRTTFALDVVESSSAHSSAAPSAPRRLSTVEEHKTAVATAMKEHSGGLFRDIWYLILDELPILTVVSLIGIGIGHVEGWNVTMSLYWAYVSGTSIGLGDEAPTNQYVRLGCVLFLPLCVAVLGEVLSRIAGLYMSRKRRKSQEEFFSRALTLADLETMDTDKDGDVSQAEFLTYMLCALQLVDKEDIDEINELFHTLDKDRTGVLHKQDLETLDWNRSITQSLADIATSKTFQAKLEERATGRKSTESSTTGTVRDAASAWVERVRLPGRPTSVLTSALTRGSAEDAGDHNNNHTNVI